MLRLKNILFQTWSTFKKFLKSILVNFLDKISENFEKGAWKHRNWEIKNSFEYANVSKVVLDCVDVEIVLYFLLIPQLQLGVKTFRKNCSGKWTKMTSEDTYKKVFWETLEIMVNGLLKEILFAVFSWNRNLIFLKNMILFFLTVSYSNGNVQQSWYDHGKMKE